METYCAETKKSHKNLAAINTEQKIQSLKSDLRSAKFFPPKHLNQMQKAFLFFSSGNLSVNPLFILYKKNTPSALYKKKAVTMN